MTPIRLALLAFTAALLPSCRHYHEKWVVVTVENKGAVSADVQAEAEYWPDFGQEDHLDLRIFPDQSGDVLFKFDELKRLRILIFRTSDNEKILDESWNREELEDLNERVTITIDP